MVKKTISNKLIDDLIKKTKLKEKKDLQPVKSRRVLNKKLKKLEIDQFLPKNRPLTIQDELFNSRRIKEKLDFEYAQQKQKQNKIVERELQNLVSRSEDTKQKEITQKLKKPAGRKPLLEEIKQMRVDAKIKKKVDEEKRKIEEEVIIQRVKDETDKLRKEKKNLEIKRKKQEKKEFNAANKDIDSIKQRKELIEYIKIYDEEYEDNNANKNDLKAILQNLRDNYDLVEPEQEARGEGEQEEEEGGGFKIKPPANTGRELEQHLQITPSYNNFENVLRYNNELKKRHNIRSTRQIKDDLKKQDIQDIIVNKLINIRNRKNLINDIKAQAINRQ